MSITGWMAAGLVLVLVVGAIIRYGRRGTTRPTPARRATAPPAPAAAAPAPAPSAPRPAPPVPPLRQVYALALNDARVANPQIMPNPSDTQLLLIGGGEFARVGSEPRYTPRRPSLLPQLLEVVNDEEASLRTLSRLVAQDPQLTGELLRTANSALYRVSSTPVESVERAAAMLGTQGIRVLVAASLVKPMTTAGGGAPGRFGETIWEHSTYSATAAEAWAARVQDCDPFTAHLLGLMHGLGAVGVYRVVADLYAARKLPRPDNLVLASALDTHAALTARRIAASWGLSEKTQEALEAQSAAAPVGDPGPLGRALQFGHAAGTAVLLCRQQLGETEGRQLLAAAGFEGPQVQRIWDRLLRAYVRP